MGGGGVTGSELCSQLVDHVRLRLNEQLERLVLLSQLLDFLLDFHALNFNDFLDPSTHPVTVYKTTTTLQWSRVDESVRYDE